MTLVKFIDFALDDLRPSPEADLGHSAWAPSQKWLFMI